MNERPPLTVYFRAAVFRVCKERVKRFLKAEKRNLENRCYARYNIKEADWDPEAQLSVREQAPAADY